MGGIQRPEHLRGEPSSIHTSAEALGFNQATVVSTRLAGPTFVEPFLMLFVPYQMLFPFSSYFTARQRLHLVVPRYRRPVTCW